MSNGIYGSANDADSRKVLDRALELGQDSIHDFIPRINKQKLDIIY